jgi:PAS domain S-box-containing protein
MTNTKHADGDPASEAREVSPSRAAQTDAAVSEQARREERRHHEQLRVTLSSIGDAVIVTDDRGVVTFLNPVAEALTGWRSEQAIGKPLDDVFHIVHEETRALVESPVTKVLAHGVTVGLANHTVLLTRDGREIPIDDSGAPIRDEEDRILGVVLVFRDVTEARRAIDARLRLAAIVESSDDAIISKDLDGRIQSWNRGAQQLYGYAPEEIIGKSIAILVPPDHDDELPAIMERLRRGERIEHFETRRVAKDGRRLDISLTISPVRNSVGKLVGASAIARDITKTKRTEAALRFLAEASALLAELVDVPTTLQMVAGLAVPHFADWCAVDMTESDGTLRRLGVAHVDPAKVELVRALHERYPPDPNAPQGAVAVLRTGKSEVMADIPSSLLEQATADAEHLRVIRDLGLKSYMCVPLCVRGQVIGVVSFVTAESGRSYGESDLRLAEDLANRAAIAIENARLYSDLKDADRRKDEFLAMLAHELRNPLAPIRNAMQIMRLAGADREVTDRARVVVERQVEQLVRLVDDLLDVSRIMRGKIELRKERVELASIVTQAVEVVQPTLDANGQTFEISAPPQPVILHADPVRISQVVGNIIQNAAKFSAEQGRIHLTIDSEDRHVVLRVRDEGAGIHPDLLPHVFDLFVQGDKSLQRSEGGMGIGLTVVKRLVQMHGGHVEVHSPGVGQGSEFAVKLPLAQETPAGHERANGGTEATVQPIARRILVVDDNVDAADTIALLLQMWGHEVRTVYSGPEAIEAAEDFAPEVVLLDIGLPGINGYDVARRLRARPQRRRTVLAAMTGYGQESDRDRSREAGFDHHLTKPVAPEVLQKILAEL